MCCARCWLQRWAWYGVHVVTTRFRYPLTSEVVMKKIEEFNVRYSSYQSSDHFESLGYCIVRCCLLSFPDACVHLRCSRHQAPNQGRCQGSVQHPRHQRQHPRSVALPLFFANFLLLLCLLFFLVIRCNDACQPFARFAASHAPTAPPVTRRHSFVLTQALRHSTSPTRYSLTLSSFTVQMRLARLFSTLCLQLLEAPLVI